MEKGLSRKRIVSVVQVAAIAGAVLFLASVIGFGAVLDGYSQALHPVSLLGATGVPRAQVFNLLAFVLPGLLAALVAMGLRARLPAPSGWCGRLGTQMLLLSGLGLAAMGLLPLDPQDLESAASRLHGTAWSGWVVAFAAGASALAMGLRGTGSGTPLAWASSIAVPLFLVAALLMPELVGAGMAQRLAFLVWFGWFAYAARPASLAPPA